MTFKNNIPQPTDNLSDSQVDLLNNMSQLDTSFGVDHYTFSDLTANNGFHNQITTPVYVATPSTGLPPNSTATLAKMYGFQDSPNIGVINYSRGWDLVNMVPAVPTPLTCLQSQAGAISLAVSPGPGNTTTVLDFAGLARGICTLYVVSLSGVFTPAASFNRAEVMWNGATLLIPNQIGSVILSAVISGSKLLIQNTATVGPTVTAVYWTLVMHRLQ